MTGKSPQRSCLGCRAVKDKKELLRFVLAPDRTLVPDILAKLPGRGAYTCMNRACLSGAAMKKQFSRAFRGEVICDGADRLVARVISHLEERIASYLALANKAGKLVSGSDMVMESIKRNKAGVVFIAVDVSPEIGAKVEGLAKRCAVPCVVLFEKEHIGALAGKGPRSAAAIERSGFIDVVINEIGKYRNFFEGGMDAR